MDALTIIFCGLGIEALLFFLWLNTKWGKKWLKTL